MSSHDKLQELMKEYAGILGSMANHHEKKRPFVYPISGAAKHLMPLREWNQLQAEKYRGYQDRMIELEPIIKQTVENVAWLTGIKKIIRFIRWGTHSWEMTVNDSGFITGVVSGFEHPAYWFKTHQGVEELRLISTNNQLLHGYSERQWYITEQGEYRKKETENA